MKGEQNKKVKNKFLMIYILFRELNKKNRPINIRRGIKTNELDRKTKDKHKTFSHDLFLFSSKLKIQ